MCDAGFSCQMRMNFRMDEKLPPMQRVILAVTIIEIIGGEKKVKSTSCSIPGPVKRNWIQRYKKNRANKPKEEPNKPCRKPSMRNGVRM